MFFALMSASPNYGRRREDAMESERVDVDLESIFDTACLQTGLERKSAAALMQMDESQLSKALRGVKGHDIGLRKVMRLPPTFHAVFMCDLIKASFAAWAKRTWSQITTRRGEQL